MLNPLLKILAFRNVGPSRGGRVVACAGDPNDVATYYFGAVCGGIYKTTDAGMTWKNISDGQLKTSSVGALTVCASDPNVIYVGMGEASIRTDVSYGDGLYKSTDAGRTWKHMGLDDTRHIGKIVVHPKNPDLVFVAALGHAFGPNEERGVFRSKDGGTTWQKVLFKSNRAGAIDITIDEHNPNILYAALWQVYRNFWYLDSGGAESGIWRSSDGGDTWTEITHNKGLDKLGLLGKVGVSASPVQAGRVWALCEGKDKPGMYRSDDFGDTWTLVSDLGDLRRRPWYYMHVHADPVNADTVYVNNLGFHKSTDGGKTWTAIATPHGDNHGLWIDPKNNRRMIQSNDGGANVSFNGGETFSSIYNQLTGQIYQMDTDNQFPYRMYGTQQDNSSISVPSDTITGTITWGDCYVAGTGESGYIAVKPDDPNIVIVGAVGSSPGGLGALQKYDHHSKQIQLINVWPQAYAAVDPSTFKHRFPWTYPIVFSPHDSNKLYACGECVFVSDDLGHSWTKISHDLTRNDPEKLKASGGAITLDTSGAEHYCTLFTFRESPHEKGVLMTGSDDGLVHLSRNGGKKWDNITPKDLPEWSFIRTVEPSPHDKNTWYLAATKYKLDDFSPYVYVTRNGGKSWEKITGTGEDKLPANEPVRVIRTDTKVKGLLYAGTEQGLYLSTNDGKTWSRWEGFPVVPVYDIHVKNDDLIAATHGRGFWVADDISPLREFVEKAPKAGLHLYSTGTAYRVLPDLFAQFLGGEGKDYGIGLGSESITIAGKDDNNHPTRKFLDCGAGRDKGAILIYNLPEGAKHARLELLDAKSKLLRTFTPKPADYDQWDDKKKSTDIGPWMPVKVGLNRFVWNLKHAGALRVPGNKTAPEVNEGPFVIPGEYEAKLIVDGKSVTASITVVNDPRAKVSKAELAAQEKLLLNMRDKISDAHKSVNQIRAMRDQVNGWKTRVADNTAHKALADKCVAVSKKLDAIEDELILPGEQKDGYGLIARTRLNAQIGSLMSVVNSADAKPTTQSQELFKEMAGKVSDQMEALDEVMNGDVAELNALIAKSGLQAVGV